MATLGKEGYYKVIKVVGTQAFGYLLVKGSTFIDISAGIKSKSLLAKYWIWQFSTGSPYAYSELAILIW